MRFGGSSKKNKSSTLKQKGSANAPAADNKMTDSIDDSDNSGDATTPIYYFGYGAMVNPIARQRRGVNTDEAHAALLRNYRLTFSYGGAANIVEARGYEVFGIVMKCSTVADWNLLKDFDAGYDCVEVDVFALKQKDMEKGEDDDESSLASEEEGFAQVYETPIKARVFVLPKDQLTAASSSPDTPPKIPQERYLKVIASGMRAYGVDPDYVNDEIMGVEFIPSRKPENYLSFPPAADEIPTLPSLEAWEKEYQKLIQKETHKAKKNKTSTPSSGLIIFRLGEHVMKVTSPDMNNPFNVWAKDRMHGPQDSTWVIVQTLFDPDLPLIAKPEEVSSAHQLWAENQMMEKFQQAGVEATTIYRVQLDNAPTPSSQSHPQYHKPGRRGSVRSFVRNSLYSFKSRGTSTTASQRSNSLNGGSNHQQHPQRHHNPPLSPTRSTTPSITSSTTSSKRNRLFRHLPTLILRTKLLPTLRSNNSSSNHSHSRSATSRRSGRTGGGSTSNRSSRRSSIKNNNKENSIKADGTDHQQPVVHNNSTSHYDDDNSVTESCCIDRCEGDQPDIDDDDLISPSVLAIHDGGGCCLMIGDSSGELQLQCNLVQDHEEDTDHHDVTFANDDDHHHDTSNNNDTISCSNSHEDDDDHDELNGSSDGPPPISTLSFATTTLTEEAKKTMAAAATTT